jgi:cell division protein FtsB
VNNIHKIFISFTGVALFLFFWVIILGGRGLHDLAKMKKGRDILVEKNEKIDQENSLLYKRIVRLKEDPKFIENVAREELGMIGKDEVIYKLKKDNQ